MKINCKKSNPAGNQSRPFFDLKWSGPTGQESFRRGFLWFIFNSVLATAVSFYPMFLLIQKYWASGRFGDRLKWLI